MNGLLRTPDFDHYLCDDTIIAAELESATTLTVSNDRTATVLGLRSHRHGSTIGCSERGGIGGFVDDVIVSPSVIDRV